MKRIGKQGGGRPTSPAESTRSQFRLSKQRAQQVQEELERGPDASRPCRSRALVWANAFLAVIPMLPWSSPVRTFPAGMGTLQEVVGIAPRA